MAYIPGAGLKRPLNMLETPVYPDIKRELPRFKWTGKRNWKVDTGTVMKEVENIPQLQEAAILYQSYDYGRQHAYGHYPSYNDFVNKEFRPPLLDQDDIFPLSRIPRPVVVPTLNPGGAHPSGNSVFADQNMNLPGIEKYLTDRVKRGEARPTFYAPLELPIDNSILPDLELKLPAISASAGYRFPALTPIEVPDLDRGYKKIDPSAIADSSFIKIDTPDSRRDMELDYKIPQVSAHSGVNWRPTSGVTPIDIALDYKIPQVSAHSGVRPVNVEGFTHLDLELDYNIPQVSVSAGFKSVDRVGLTPINFDLEEKIEGNQAVFSGVNTQAIYNLEDDGIRRDTVKIGDKRPSYSYHVPANTRPDFQKQDSTGDSSYKKRISSLTSYSSLSPPIPGSYIRRPGISIPQVKNGLRR